MAQGLSRVEELFEARSPKLVAEICDLDGTIQIENTDKNTIVRVIAEDLMEEEYYLQEDFVANVKVGQNIKSKQIIARSTKDKQKIVASFP
jgi:DNA-directed RNA polymerase, beta' subunit